MLSRPLVRAVGVITVGLTVSFAPSAGASTEGSAPPGGGLGGLAVSVDVAGRIVRYEACKADPCKTSAPSPSIAIAAGDNVLDAKRVTVEPVSIGAGKHLVHVKIGLTADGGPEDLAWEALIGAAGPPIFAGLTGWSRGEPGERAGTDLRLLEGEGRTIVVIGDIREDLRICGDDATLLDPRGLDPATLSLRGATLQRLSAARREGAKALVASPRHAQREPSLAPLLLATEASGGTPAAALTDGDASTAWSEGRPGRGQGEFVLMRAPFDVPIERFSITIAPTTPKPEGAAPSRFFLATGASTFVVTMPDDAWSHPGDAYDIPLPEPIQTSCVALVLEDAFARGKAHPEVTVAELTAYSAFDHPGTTLAEVAAALKDGGARAGAAAAVLERAGAPGLAATLVVYPVLDEAGRALALNIAASAGSCSASAPLLVLALGDPDTVVREKARAKLEEPSCGREAVPALIAGLADLKTRRGVAPLLALLGRDKAATPLTGVLGDGPADLRHVVRSSLAYATRESSGADLAALFGTVASKPAEARLDLVRALSDRLDVAREAADAAIGSLLSGAPETRVRYLLVDPIAKLAEAGDEGERARLAGIILHDADGAVRAHATEHIASAKDASTLILAALRDPNPRVRETSLHAAGAGHVAAATSATVTMLAADPWTFVRVAAAEALGALPETPSSDSALGDALTQLSPRVREQATLALGVRGAVGFREVIREQLGRVAEESAVRNASARALGMLCDSQAVEALSKLATIGGMGPDAAQVSLGLVATEALGKIHPADLAARFSPLQAKTVRPDARAAAQRALAEEGRCRR